MKGIRLLTLDVSTNTGYAAWETNRDISSIEAGVIELPAAQKFHTGKTDYSWDDWRVAQMGPKIYKLLKWFGPDLVIVEQRLRFSKTGDGAFAMTNALHGAIYSHCCTMNILFGTVPSDTWRVAAYGEGFKQPLVPAMDRQRRQKLDPKTGAPLFKSKDWGDIAVEACEELGIVLPRNKEIAHNAAEACLMARTWWRCRNKISIPEKRAYDRFIQLLQGRNERGAAA